MFSGIYAALVLSGLLFAFPMGAAELIVGGEQYPFRRRWGLIAFCFVWGSFSLCALS